MPLLLWDTDTCDQHRGWRGSQEGDGCEVVDALAVETAVLLYMLQLLLVKRTCRTQHSMYVRGITCAAMK